MFIQPPLCRPGFSLLAHFLIFYPLNTFAMSLHVTKTVSAISTKKPMPWNRFLALLVNFFLNNLKPAIVNHRPPSSAGIGSTFITASVSEMIAASSKICVTPELSTDGNRTPKMPTGLRPRFRQLPPDQPWPPGEILMGQLIVRSSR